MAPTVTSIRSMVLPVLLWLCAAPVSVRALEYRLSCSGVTPGPFSRPWPRAWTNEGFIQGWYTDNQQLCDEQSSLANNGCKCGEKGGILCNENNPSITAWCTSRCTCRARSLSRYPWTSTRVTDQKAAEPTPLAKGESPPSAPVPAATADTEPVDIQADCTASGSGAADTSAEANPPTCSAADAPNSTTGSCLGTCNTVAIGCPDGCKCGAFHSQVHPTIRFLGRCGSFSPKRLMLSRRADVIVANMTGSDDDSGAHELIFAGCPCNTSYVSDACCLSSDGIVYEDPGKKLGELDDDA